MDFKLALTAQMQLTRRLLTGTRWNPPQYCLLVKRSACS